MRPLSTLLLLAAAACASRGRPTDVARDAPIVRVTVFGDMPYDQPSQPGFAAGLAAYRRVLDAVAAREADFIVHIGDFTAIDCSDSVYAVRLAEFQALPHPLIFTPGDNEWTDCARSGGDPLERLARLRAVFMDGDRSLGRRTIALERQSDDWRFGKFRENARWRAGGTLFLTLHAVGGRNNWGPDSTTPSAEFRQREDANIAWLRDAYALATRERARGVVIFMQASPARLGETNPAQWTPPFARLLAELRDGAVAFGRPVALVHGDGHKYRIDKPFFDSRGRIIPDITRAETFGDPSLHALGLIVDPADPNLFRFEPIIVR